MTAYLLSDDAEADVRAILGHTRKQWGNAQMRGYHAKLKQGMDRLARGQGVFKDLSEIYPGLRMAHCEHHYLFCLLRNAAPAAIIAVFHERMDLMARLAGRLK
jgi:plasmid stabilization system protein ParE